MDPLELLLRLTLGINSGREGRNRLATGMVLQLVFLRSEQMNEIFSGNGISRLTLNTSWVNSGTQFRKIF